jgi:hypothetical protein
MRVGFAASEKARYEGKIDEGGMPCGQGAAMITSIKPAGQIVHDCYGGGARHARGAHSASVASATASLRRRVSYSV